MPPLTWPYIHITVNHFPVVLSVLGMVAAIFALIRNKRAIWLYTMATMTAAGVMAGVAYISGDEADDFLHDPWYIKPGVIDAHQDAATWALVVLIATGLICAYSWWRALRYRDEPIPRPIRTLVVIGTIMSAATVARTAYLGGKIVHEAPVLALPSAPAGVQAPSP